jgi:hypothetical protein
MESNEYKITESLIIYHRKKHELELVALEKRLNDRINKLNDRVNELLDELKPVTTKEFEFYDVTDNFG